MGERGLRKNFTNDPLEGILRRCKERIRWKGKIIDTKMQDTRKKLFYIEKFEE